MLRLMVVSAFIAFTTADVRPLFRGNQPAFQPLQISPNRPISSAYAARILRSDFDLHPDGTYSYAYGTENGISAQQQGQQKQIGAESGNVAQGSFAFTSPEGVPVVVQYIADENGFQPQSDVLPTPPPIPEAILRSLQYNAAHPEPEQPPVPSSLFGRRF